jgi:hypothetical protein
LTIFERKPRFAPEQNPIIIFMGVTYMLWPNSGDFYLIYFLVCFVTFD